MNLSYKRRISKKNNDFDWNTTFQFFQASPGLFLVISILGYLLISLTYTIPLIGIVPTIPIEYLPAFLISTSLIFLLVVGTCWGLYSFLFTPLLKLNIFELVENKLRRSIFALTAFFCSLFGVVKVIYIGPFFLWSILILLVLYIVLFFTRHRNFALEILLYASIFSFIISPASYASGNLETNLLEFLNDLYIYEYILIIFGVIFSFQQKKFKNKPIFIALMILAALYLAPKSENQNYSLLANFGLKLAGIGGALPVTILGQEKNSNDSCAYLVFSDYKTSWVSASKSLKKPFDQYPAHKIKIGCNPTSSILKSSITKQNKIVINEVRVD